MPLAWEVISEKCPTMASIVEQKIAHEIAKKQAEIDALKQENQNLRDQIDTLALQILDIMGV